MFRTILFALELFTCSAEANTCPLIKTYAPTDAVFFEMRRVERSPLTYQPAVDPGLAYACCDFYGECYWVDMMSECPFPWDVYYCEWGVTNLDGTVDCYD